MVDLKFDGRGLLLVVAQDAASGLVLMVAHMNQEALDRTLASGDAWYWSRSRGTLWRKGEVSGHTQRVRALRVDCDGDALLLLVDQEGAACHTGQASCFFRDIHGSEVGPSAVKDRPDILDDLFQLIKERRTAMEPGSYTASLLRGGRAQIARKVQEETEELTRAARAESDQRVVEEAADLLYHTWVFLAERGVELRAVRQELERRRHGR